MASSFNLEDLNETMLQDSATLPAELIEHLLSEAAAARNNAYAPYSRYRVGAALLVDSNRIGKRIFTGCNVESETFTPTMCAERVAAGSAIAAGAEPGSFVAVAIVAGKEMPSDDDYPVAASPCGVCRQLLHELSRGRLLVVSAPADRGPLPGGTGFRSNGERKVWTIIELLPDAFSGQV